MRLANFRNFKFSNLSFYHYFFTAYIGLHVTFSILLGNITAFAPDEKYPYLNVFGDIYSKGYKVSYLTPAFGDESPPTIFLQLLYMPARLIAFFGSNDLVAIRLMSILYSTLAKFFLARMAITRNRDTRFFRFSLIMISFIPSVFLWSSTGLREGFLYFEISLILFFASELEKKLSFINVFGLFLGSYSLLMTKNYLFVIIAISAFLTSLVFFAVQKKPAVRYLLIFAMILTPILAKPGLISQTITFSSLQSATESTGDLNQNGICEVTEYCESNGGIPTSGGIPTTGGIPNLIATGGSTVHLLLQELESNPKSLVARLASTFGITEKLNLISSSALVVESDKKILENKKELSLQQAGLKNPNQVFTSSIKFLSEPLLFVDNGSLFLNIQSLETPIWLFMYGLFGFGLYQIFRRRLKVEYATVMGTFFILGFVAISALTEINVGTALRHRSLLLIPILVIWASSEKKSVSI